MVTGWQTRGNASLLFSQARRFETLHHLPITCQITAKTITAWWFGTWLLWLSIQLGFPTDELHHFSVGRSTTNHIYIYTYINCVYSGWIPMLRDSTNRWLQKPKSKIILVTFRSKAIERWLFQFHKIGEARSGKLPRRSTRRQQVPSVCSGFSLKIN